MKSGLRTLPPLILLCVFLLYQEKEIISHLVNNGDHGDSDGDGTSISIPHSGEGGNVRGFNMNQKQVGEKSDGTDGARNNNSSDKEENVDKLESHDDAYLHDDDTKNDLEETVMVASQSNMWCPAALMKVGAETMSPSHVWKHLQEQILDAAHVVHPGMGSLNATQMQAYDDWISQLFSFYTVPRLRRSVMNPAPPQDIIKFLKLMDEVQQHNAQVAVNDQDGNGGDDGTFTKKRMIRVLVLGGSVTAGHGCEWPALLGLYNKRGNVPHKDCAWSAHLEKILNAIFFNGEDIIRVDNMASGGQTSEFGAMVLEYRLYPEPQQIPDVIISSFSANESKEPDVERVFYEFMQSFVKGAGSLQPCDDHAPLTIMVDDFYGDMPFGATLQTGKIYMMSTWNNLMAVNYGSTIKHKVHAEAIGGEHGAHTHPLLTSTFNVHNGIGAHIGVAWTIVFNLINSIVNVCNDGNISPHEYEAGNEIYVPPQHWNMTLSNNNTKTSHPKFVDDTNNDTDTENVNVKQELNIPSIEPDLLSTVQHGEPPFKHLGPIERGVPGRAEQVKNNLKENMIKNQKLCAELEEAKKAEDVDGSSKNSNTNQKCSYAWVVNHLSGFSTKEQLAQEMKSILVSNNGWAAEGRPIVQPRTGWYTHTANATFAIQIDDTPVDTNFVLILSMKSYGPHFIGSKLAVSTTVLQQGNESTIDVDLGHNTSESSSALANSTQSTNHTVDWDNQDSLFLIDGYHKTRTSVHFPHKVPIPGGAKAGSSIILNAKLVGGSYFKIAGIAFCSF